MFKKMIFTLIYFWALSCVSSFAADITLQLNFPAKGPQRISAPKAIEKPLEVYGNLAINIAPYPTVVEKDRYSVEYYLNDQLIFSTSGFKDSDPSRLSFGYILNTASYANGEYKLIVNFYDKSGPSAIGIKKILIKNEESN